MRDLRGNGVEDFKGILRATINATMWNSFTTVMICAQYWRRKQGSKL
jgi:hypothetical protein